MNSRIWTALVAIMVAFVATSLSAQEIDPIDVYQDPNGIDLASNNVSTSQLPTLSIPAAPELAFRDLADFIPLLEVTTGNPPPGFEPEVYRVSAGNIASDAFANCTYSTCYSTNGSGAVLFNAESTEGQINGFGGITYRQGNTGKTITFTEETEISGGTMSQPVRKFLALEVHNPGGVDLGFTYDSLSIGGILRHRPSTVTSTSGYQLRFTYFSNVADLNWGNLQKVEIVAITNPSVILASQSYSGNTVTDIAGRVFACVCQPDIYPIRPEQRASRMKLPGEAGYSFDTFRQQGSNVRTVTTDGVTFTYTSTPDNSWTQPLGSPWPIGAIHDITITGPNGFYQFVDVTNTPSTTGPNDPPRRRIDSVTDSLGNITSYEYTAQERLRKVIHPEGNSVTVNYDLLGNLTSSIATAKPGSNLASITQSASYPTTGCGMIGFNCYRPTSVTDGKGNVTEFTWNAWGAVETELGPPDENSRRRKVINTWSGTTAINGETCPAFVQFGLPGPPRCAPRLLKEEVCETDVNGNELTCGTANSYVREFTYFEATSLPLSETVKDGAGNYPLTTTYTYDAAGRQLSMDGPLPGSEDAVYALYDQLGRKEWEVGPQGENGYRPATFTEYRNADDQVRRVRAGYVAGSTTAASTPVFIGIIISDVETDYNSRRLATETTVKSGTGTLFSVTQMSYDGLNRTDCTAVRMDLSNILTDPCDAADIPGMHGPDRITRQHYDTESRVVRIEQGVDTSLVRDYATYTFTPNGQMASMTDARGYKASMMYDGFDRQTHWYFPSPTTTGAINPNDYEQYGYDANGNRISLRKRDGSVITYLYDNLNRVIRKTIPDTRPELHADHTRDVFYEYDIRGLQLHARFGSDSGVGTTSVYDRYGRMTSVTDNTSGTARTLQSDYLPDGQRWLLTYPDAQAFRFYYWPGGQFNHMTAPLGEIMVDYDYDNEGRLDQIRRDSTAPKQQWGYDAIGRMNSNFIDAPSAAFDVTWGYTRNPATQISSESQTNDSFSWDGYVPVDRSYATNGLNQYTSVSGQAYCYDNNGNLTADGQFVYLYDVENRLVEMRAPANTDCENLAYTGEKKAELHYDPMGRLYQVENFISGVGQGPVTMLYDGDALVAEYNASGTMLARYVHGPMQGVDDPIAEYNGSSVSAANRTNLYTDSRGSIVLRAGATGGTPSINTYNEYGQPSTSNVGRFQYTGQVWLPELGMYYYKARIYSPSLGRFMQTDPIGYEDNVNLYGYVGQDPINLIDPTGMESRNPPPKDTEAVTGSRIQRDFGSAKSFAQANLANTTVVGISGTAGSDGAGALGASNGGTGGSFSGRMQGPTNYTDEETLLSLRITFAAAPIKPGSSADRKSDPDNPEYDPWHRAAISPTVRSNAALTGEIFWTPSNFNPFGAAVLQAPGTFNGTVGIYEYMIPLSGPISTGEPFLFSAIVGAPMIVHATFRLGNVGDVPLGN